MIILKFDVEDEKAATLSMMEYEPGEGFHRLLNIEKSLCRLTTGDDGRKKGAKAISQGFGLEIDTSTEPFSC